jgi:iron complex transport system permease protein
MSSVLAADPGPFLIRARRRRMLAIGGTGALLVVCFLAAIGYGAVAISPLKSLAILAAPIGLDLPWSFTEREALVVSAIRLPRACLAVLAGAALAVSGATLQGLFRNPLADPALIGVSNGAAAAAVAVIVLGGGLASEGVAIPLEYLLPVAAFGGGLAAVYTVYRLACRDGHTDVPTLLLGGVAISAIAGAAIGFFVFISTEQQLRDLSFWMLGSLASVTWEKLAPAALLIGAGIAPLPFMARFLDVILLGEAEARHLGFDVERTKRLVVLLCALAAGASVAVTGVIGFVGLVVPHLVRLVAGPGHRIVLPASILLGASLMLVADVVARTIVLPAELPIGVLTSCIGGPFFLWLLVRRRAMQGW